MTAPIPPEYSPSWFLDLQRELTEWFINLGPPTDVVLKPMVEVKTPGKGVTKTYGTPRQKQQFKLIWGGDDGLQTNEDGTAHKYNLIMVGKYDCKAEIGDVWESASGQKYYIHSEYPFNNYERKFGLYSWGRKASDVSG